MNITLNIVENDPMDRIMGTQTKHSSISTENIDAISATANDSGFTPLTAMARHYNWNKDIIVKACEQCNNKGEIAIIQQLSPTVLLVPKTSGQNQENSLAADLANACSAISAQKLRFTHYGFILNKLPADEIESILVELKNTETTLEDVIWDIEEIHKIEMESIIDKVFN
jgi:hypothetical protein